MDFDQLISFIAVAELGNFSRAAEKVLRSQPAISAQIRKLEEENGAKLFDRTKKLVTLTPAGELFLDYAKQMIALRQESLQVVADSGSDVRGVLSIGANETTFLHVLPGLLSRYHTQFPEVRISVYRNFSHKVLQKVEDNELELGVVTMPVRSSTLIVTPIYRDPLVWIAASSSEIAKRKAWTTSEVAQQDLILHKMGSLRRIMEKQLRPFRPQLKVTMELTSAEMVKKFVSAGLGISMICESFVQEEVKEGKIKILRTDAAPIYRELGLVYREGRSLSRAAKRFVLMAMEGAPKERDFTNLRAPVLVEQEV
ncbi:MAG TPA: LysR family transcriptional regulator [Terriglobales bacterium]|nr:LysR family transcriptional regulator [Terriglobales bacterium]